MAGVVMEPFASIHGVHYDERQEMCGVPEAPHKRLSLSLIGDLCTRIDPSLLLPKMASDM